MCGKVFCLNWKLKLTTYQKESKDHDCKILAGMFPTTLKSRLLAVGQIM